MARQTYPSDLTDNEWRTVETLITPERGGGRDRSTDMREVMNAMLYRSHAACSWRMLPHDLPAWQTVYHYFQRWHADGTFRRLNAAHERKSLNPLRKWSPLFAMLGNGDIVENQPLQEAAVFEAEQVNEYLSEETEPMTQTDAIKADILIVDDIPDTQVAVKSRLERQGYHVREAVSGELALAAIEEKAPDLILMDIRMPDMDGPELCARLKADANEAVRNIPMIFISAYAMESDKINAFGHGGVDFVTKPVSAEEVLVRVKTHLAIREVQRKLEERNIQLEKEINGRVQAEKALWEHTRQLESLHNITNVFASSLAVNEVLDLILEQLSFVIRFDSATIFLADNSHFLGVAARGLPHPEQVIGHSFPADDLFQQVLERLHPFWLDDAQTDSRFMGYGGTDYARGWLSAPLLTRKKVIGFMTIDSREVCAYGPRQASLVQPFANQAAQAIENARLHEQVRKDAAELEDRVYERTETLRKITNAMSGRELRMIELKGVIRKLHAQLLEAGLEPVAEDPLMAGLGAAGGGREPA